MTCWRSECRNGCYYPDACNEGGEQPEAIREAFALGAAWALGDDEGTPAALREQVAECELLLRMATDARARAERQSEVQEAAIERARKVLDGWEHDGPDGYEFHLLIRRVREALDGARVDDKCPGLCGEHHWLDRPESDTRECLICGTEAAG